MFTKPEPGGNNGPFSSNGPGYPLSLRLLVSLFLYRRERAECFGPDDRVVSHTRAQLGRGKDRRLTRIANRA